MDEDDCKELQPCNGYEERTPSFLFLITFVIYVTNDIIFCYYIRKQRAIQDANKYIKVIAVTTRTTTVNSKIITTTTTTTKGKDSDCEEYNTDDLYYDSFYSDE